jgi:hypothetical protein
MKNILFIGLVLAGFAVQAQQWGREFGINFTHVNPIGGMGQVIKRGNGATFNYGFVRPDGRFSFGLDMSVVQYGHDRSRQEYTMSDGSVAPMDVIVNNSFVNMMAYSRWYLATKGLVRPYLAGQVGYSRYGTDLSIYDPDDKDQCEPVDTDVLYHDGTMVAMVGAGVKIDIAAVFKKLEKGRFYLESNLNLTRGGSVRYMSEDADASHANHNTPDSDHVFAKFLNTTTMIVHEHHVGHLYRSPVQMTEFRVGFSMNISK